MSTKRPSRGVPQPARPPECGGRGQGNGAVGRPPQAGPPRVGAASRAAECRASKSVSERVLEQAVRVQERWEQGVPLQQLTADSGPDPILWNGLSTLYRHLASIDWLLNDLAARAIRPRLRRVLRWSACQILYLQGVPPPAVVDVSVALVRRRYGPAEAGFVNALLRRLASQSAESWRQHVHARAPAAVRLDLGSELYAHWSGRWSAEQVSELAVLLQEPAPVTVRRCRAAAEAPAALELSPVVLPAWAGGEAFYTCHEPKILFASDEFRRGDFQVLDPATLVAARLLAARPGERIADLCAAPGGKAVLLAEALDGQGLLLCMDRSARRLARLVENVGRRPGCRLLLGDARAVPFRPASLDAVLVDAPCSNTGVIRRRPDVRWRFTRQSLAELTALQAAVLCGVAPLPRPGGRLVYSTCSLEPEENALQVRRFLAEHRGYRLVQELDLYPCREHDGAYAALLSREA